MQTHNHTVFNQVFDYAITLGALTRNPSHGVKKVKIEEFEASFYTIDEIKHMLSLCTDPLLKLFIIISVMLGTRRSETCGLKWENISLEDKKIYIRHTVVVGVNAKIYQKDETKTMTSKRDYTLSNELVDLLQQHKNQQEEYKRLLGEQYHNSDYIFCKPDGTVYRPDHFTRAFGKFLKKNSLAHIRLHDLRHSTASMLANLGFSERQIQDWCGWSSFKMLKKYVHVYDEDKVKMANETASALLAKNSA